MGKIHLVSMVTSIFLFLFVSACGGGAPASPQGGVTPDTGGAKAGTGPAAETERAGKPPASEWERLLLEAKKEGRIALHSVANGELRVALIKAAKEKFGLELDMVSGRAAELTPRLFNERKAGIYAVDVYIGGGGTLINDLKPAGVFEPITPQLFLAEALDPKAWWGGELIYLDKDKQVIAMVANPSPPIAINTNLVGKDEIKSYLDLLNPKWKGKMILNDPTTPGIAQFWFGVASSRIMNVDYMQKLAQTNLTVTRDQRLQVEWLTQGKYPIAIAAQQSTVGQFKKDGAPLELLTPKEGTHVTSSSGNIAILNKAPHPNAAKLFINWLLTREGQTVFSQAVGFQSARLDVPTSHLEKDGIRQDGVKYFSSIDEDFLRTLPEHARIARGIFGNLR